MYPIPIHVIIRKLIIKNLTNLVLDMESETSVLTAVPTAPLIKLAIRSTTAENGGIGNMSIMAGKVAGFGLELSQYPHGSFEKYEN